MNVIETPQARCKAAVVRCDITPPVGIYHRMWGAALHDRATGVHRPLFATLLWLEPEHSGGKDPTTTEPILLVSLDHCILDRQEIQSIRQTIQRSTGVASEQVLVTLTHTHGAGWMSRSRSDLPGGEMLGPYLDNLAKQIGDLAKEAQNSKSSAAMVFATSRCNLAAHRNYFDQEHKQFVCGWNPGGPADDTMMLAKITDLSGRSMATIVNYACHPTTLAWDNTLISPDWIGSMRQVIEQEQGGVCMFLQGASGDLGPRDGFVGDTLVADRNGKQVGFAALSTLATLPEPLTQCQYTGSVVSGTRIGTWGHKPLSAEATQRLMDWQWETLIVELPYRHDLPTIQQTELERGQWQDRERQAREQADELAVRDARAQVEQRTRQLTRLENLVSGSSYPLEVRLGILGAAIWIFVPGELYQVFQRVIRERFSPRPVFVTTLTNDWQPGYIPAASSYGYEIYQEVIAATAPGCLELLIESISRRIRTLIDDGMWSV